MPGPEADGGPGTTMVGFHHDASGGPAARDIDFVSDSEPGRSPFDPMRMENNLVALLGQDIDVVDVKALKPRDDDIRASAIWL